MRFILTLSIIFTALFSFAQDNQIPVTLNGISDIKLHMKKADLEKLLGQKLTLKNITSKNDDNHSDTVQCTYKGIDLNIVLDKTYTSENKYDIVVGEIKSSSPLLKTKSGIGIGDDKCKIISMYDGYLITIESQYDDANYTIKSKTRSSVWLHGDSGSAIIFYMDSNKITAMTVTIYEGD